MIENCTLYLSTEKLDLNSIFPDIKSDKGLFRKPTYFEYYIDDLTVRLNIMPKDQISSHLNGFQNYVSQLENTQEDKAQAINKISSIKNVLGVTLSRTIDVDEDAFKSLFYLTQKFDGFMFIFDSILLPDGKFIVGPASYKDNEISEPKQIKPEYFKHERSTEGIPKELVEMREKNYLSLAEHGFICARWLPINTDSKLRPAHEIASRLYALNALVMWVTLPEDFMPTDMLVKLIENQNIRSWLTEDEKSILSLSRQEAQEEHISSIGWRFENMWPLAWILGFETPPLFYIGQMPEEISTPMLLQFLPENKNPEHLLANNTIRPESEIIKMEDLFYCAHNAVRSAQMGKKTVPARFHPVVDGGAIHERRHSLTWCLSPGTDWEDTDLST